MAQYYSTNRTLCTASNSSQISTMFVGEGETVIVSVSTSAKEKVSFSVKLFVQEVFSLQMHQEYRLAIQQLLITYFGSFFEWFLKVAI